VADGQQNLSTSPFSLEDELIKPFDRKELRHLHKDITSKFEHPISEVLLVVQVMREQRMSLHIPTIISYLQLRGSNDIIYRAILGTKAQKK
jgi:hypothetical protein